MVHIISFQSRCAFILVSTFVSLRSVHCSSEFTSAPPTLMSPTDKRLHCEMNKFVLASPLIVAAVCEDGIVLVATHTSHLQEPLLMESPKESDKREELQDLPNRYKGPTRIESIQIGRKQDAVLLGTAGWKIDCMELVEKCRSIVQAQQARYGIDNQHLSNSDEVGCLIASMASQWLAHCYVSETVRPLSCVGILASCSVTTKRKNLYFIDATGSYRVRAFAIGNQSILVNKKLRTLEFTSYTREQAVQQIVELISTLQNNGEKNDEEEHDGESQKLLPLSKAAIMEIAALDAKTGAVVRMRRSRDKS